MTDIEHKRKKVAELEEGNQRAYMELREATNNRFSMDTSDMRRELFIEKLVEWGLVSEEQKLDFDIEFHSQVEEALVGAWQQFRAAQTPKLQVVKKPSTLLDSKGRPL